MVVIEGTVDVGSTTGAWPTVPIGAGTMTFAHPRAPQPMQADVNDLARTRDWVERVGKACAGAGGRLEVRDHRRDRDRRGDRGDPGDPQQRSSRGDPPPATTSTSAGTGTRETRPPPPPPPSKPPR